MAQDNTFLLVLLAVGAYFLYTKSQAAATGITAQTYAGAPQGSIMIGPPSPVGTTGSTTAPTDVGGIVMGPGY